MTATDIYAEHERSMRELHGLTPSRRTKCPRTLSGRRCLLNRPARCVCLNRLLDHRHAWTDEHGRPVVTAEPYGCAGAELAWLLMGLDVLGLDVTVTGASPWYLGSTFLLMLRRREDHP